MKITLITICWNSATTIRHTLETILSQQRPPDEYILIDGGSNDGTLEIIEEFRHRFQANGTVLQVEAQKRIPGEAGIPNAWNQAIRLATGDIIAMLNSDDWYCPETLSSIHDTFCNDDSLDAVVVPVDMLIGDKIDWTFTPMPTKWLPYKMTWPHPGTFFRKRVYDKLGLYNTSYRLSADYDFIWRCRLADIRWKALSSSMVFMALGGRADTNRSMARRETLTIARSHSPWYDLRPLLAYVLRVITRR